MAEIENRVYEIKKNNGCMLVFTWALIFFFSFIFSIAFISQGEGAFAGIVFTCFILLFLFLTLKSNKVSLGVYPTHIKMGRSKIKWPKIKEILIYKSAKMLIVSKHILSESEIFLINKAKENPKGYPVMAIQGLFTGFNEIRFLDSKKEFDEIIPFIEYYCETFKIKLTKHE